MISATERCVHNAARALRDKYSIPGSVTMVDQFEKEFNCHCHVDSTFGGINCVVFKLDAEETFFRLRWG